MFIENIMKNILYYFLPLAVPSTIGLLTTEKFRSRKKIILGINILLFLFIIIFSILVCPKEKSLGFEFSFYTLKKRSDGIYEASSILGEGIPEFLGINEKPSELVGIPIVQSNDEVQMRFKLNRKGYVYVFHFDSNLMELRQLFPSEDVQRSNPVSSDIWMVIPSDTKTWTFGKNIGLEVFLVYFSLKKSDNIKTKIEQLIEKTKRKFIDEETMVKNLQEQLKDFVPYYLKSTGESEHNITIVMPKKIKSYIYQAQDSQSALFCQFLRHK